MTLKKELRIQREQEFRGNNENPSSVCSGVFRIKNRKTFEKCQHCNLCQKYSRYSTRNESTREVKFRYVDSFRECELYKTVDNTTEVEKVPTTKFKQGNTTSLHIKSKREMEIEAYLRMEKEYPQLISFLTWGQLFSEAIMNRTVMDLDKVFRQSIIYTQKPKKKDFNHNIKHEYNKFYTSFRMFYSNIRGKCFINGDDAIVDKYVDTIYLDVMKMRFSIENFINKFGVTDAHTMSYILIAIEMMSECGRIYGENVYNLQRKEKLVTMQEFMNPKALRKQLDFVISCIEREYGTGKTIDFNDDINIINGVRVLYNKVRNPEIISNMMLDIVKFHDNKNTK